MKLLVGCFFFYVVRAQVAFGQEFGSFDPKNYVSVITSLRDVPTVFHKCDATFVSPDLLVTTARCISCSHKCNYYIQFSDPKKLGNTVFRVKEMITHPQYDQEALVMHCYDRFDIGLIRLEEEIKNAPVFKLPDSSFPSVFIAQMYRWQFSIDMNEFLLKTYPVKKISNEMCTNFINEYVPETEMCAYSNQTFSMGPYDQGSPLTTTFNNIHYILGIYKERNLYEAHVAKYMSIAPFADWIRTHIQYKEVLRFSY